MNTTPLARLFTVSGDVSLSLNAEAGVFFGPIHVVVFSVDLASVELIDFETAIYPSPETSNPVADNNTIYIDGADGNQNIHVYTTKTVTQQITRNQTEAGGSVLVGDIVTTQYQTIVDYGDHQDVYNLGYISDDLFKNTSRYFLDDKNPNSGQPPPEYNLIAIEPKPGGGEYSGNHSITIDPTAIGGILVEPDHITPFPDLNRPGNPRTVPLNAALIGGSGNDTFIYQGSGQAILVGNGGSNDLEGGSLEFGNYVSSKPTDSYILATLWPLAPITEPQQVKDELAESQTVNDNDFAQYVSMGLSVPGVGANNLVGTFNNDVLIGGPAGNIFEGDGANDQEFGGAGLDSYVVSGNDPAQVLIYSGLRDYTAGKALADFGYASFIETLSALQNEDQLDVVYDASGDLPDLFPPGPPKPTPVTIAALGTVLPDDSDVFPSQRPVQVKTPDVRIDASGLARLNLGGLDAATASTIANDASAVYSPYLISGLSVGNLSHTTVTSIEVSANPNGPSAALAFSGSGRVGDTFTVDTGAVPARAVTVRGVPDADAHSTIPGYTTTTVTLAAAGLPPLSLIIDNNRPEDTLTLGGTAGGDTIDVRLGPNSPFVTNVLDSSSKNLVTIVDGSALPAGAVDVQDLAASVTSVVFEFGRKVSGDNDAVFDTVKIPGTAQSLTVIGSSLGEDFNSTRDISTFQTNLIGGPGNDSFRVSGQSTYSLNGKDGNDTYIVTFGPVSSNVTIASTGRTGTDTLEADDSKNPGTDRGTDYTITPTSIVRVNRYSTFLGGFDQPGGPSVGGDYVAALAFNPYNYMIGGKHFSSVALDTGLQTLGRTRIDVVGTPFGSTMTINAFSGELAANSGPRIVRITPDNKDLDTNGLPVDANGDPLIDQFPGMDLDQIGGPLIINGSPKDLTKAGSQYATTLEVYDHLDTNRTADQISLTPTDLTRFEARRAGGYTVLSFLSVHFTNIKQVLLDAPGSQTTANTSEGAYFSVGNLTAAYFPRYKGETLPFVSGYLVAGIGNFPVYVSDDLGSLTIVQIAPFATFTVEATPDYPTTLVLGNQEHVLVQHVQGALIIDGGAGGEIVDVGNDSVNASGDNSANGSVSVHGASGDVTLNVNDKADRIQRTVTISSSAITGLIPATISYQQNAISALNIDGPVGFKPARKMGELTIPATGSLYYVLSTPNNFLNAAGRVTTTINCNSYDSVDVGNKGSVSGIAGNLAIVSPKHSTSLSIDGSQDGAPTFRRFLSIGPLTLKRAQDRAISRDVCQSHCEGGGANGSEDVGQHRGLSERASGGPDW